MAKIAKQEDWPRNEKDDFKKKKKSEIINKRMGKMSGDSSRAINDFYMCQNRC